MKRTIKQSLIFSFIIHVLILVGTIGFAYIKTITYVPEILNAHDDVYYLQNEVSFGVTGNPLTLFPFGITSIVLTSALFILFKMVFIKIRSKS